MRACQTPGEVSPILSECAFSAIVKPPDQATKIGVALQERNGHSWSISESQRKRDGLECVHAPSPFDCQAHLVLECAIRRFRRAWALLLTLAVCSYLLEEAPFSCHSAQLLAINDKPRQHRILVRYYRSLGFRKVRDVGDGLGDLDTSAAHDSGVSHARNHHRFPAPFLAP